MKRLSLKQWEETTGLRWCKDHTGKMRGIYSLSTYRGDPEHRTLEEGGNTYCDRYSKIANWVCYYCYVAGLAKAYGKTFVEKYVRQTKILNSKILEQHLSLDKVRKTKHFRFEAFGDIQTPIQVINYFNICYDNPKMRFTLWTKNPFIIEWVLKEMGYSKPKNLKIGYSNPILNDIENEKRILERWDFIDFVFTVFTEDFIKEHDIEINCGARDCASCLVCYKDSGVKYVHEKLK